MRHKKHDYNGNFVWTSYSDLSTGVMLSFILLLFVFIFLFNKKKEEMSDSKTIQNKAEVVDSFVRANKKLNRSFVNISAHIKRHGNRKCKGANFKSLSKSNMLRVQFTKTSSWFKSGKAALTKQGVRCLTYFIPYFLKNIYKKDRELSGKITSIIVEGHTNSVPFKGSKNSFYDNMELSQRRALQTVNFMMKVADRMKNKKLKPWIVKKVSANGRGFANLIYKKNKQEDKNASRRVEFKFNIDYGI